MIREVTVRIAALYGPVVMALVGMLLYPTHRKKRDGWGTRNRGWGENAGSSNASHCVFGRGDKRDLLGAAVLVQVLWLLPVLWALQMVNLWAGWWSFHVKGPAVRGMPVEMYLGWVVLWGVVPVLLLGRLPWVWRMVVMVGLDLLVMPLCAPVVELSWRWLWGEAVFVAFALLPAVLLGEWTMRSRFPSRRAWMQVVMAGMVVLFLLPECVFAVRGGGWGNALGYRTHPSVARVGHPFWERTFGTLTLQTVLLLGVIGMAAAREFGERGEGTPIPFDPPRRLVVSGPYRYVANPMQLSCLLVMLAWALVLGSGWLAAGAVVSVVYSVGLAAWDEGDDLRARFGERWAGYRLRVRNWRVRWRPYVEPDAAPARLWVSAECGPCNEVRTWFAARDVRGMEICAAEEHPTLRLRRIRYEDGEYAVDGVRAVFRALEHVHAGWAFAGMVMSMPGVWWVVQVLMDGCGLGPREIAHRVRRGNAGLSAPLRFGRDDKFLPTSGFARCGAPGLCREEEKADSSAFGCGMTNRKAKAGPSASAPLSLRMTHHLWA